MKSILALSFLVMCLVGVSVSETTNCSCTCSGITTQVAYGPDDKCTCICGRVSKRSVGVKGYAGPRGFPEAPGPRTYSGSARPGSALPASVSPYSHSSRTSKDDDMQ